MDLVSVSAERLALIDGAGELESFFQSAARPAWTSPGVVVLDPDQEMHRAFGREAWREFVTRVLATEPQERTGERLWMLLSEIPVATVVGPNASPDEPAVVFEGDEITAAWVPAPSARRGAPPMSTPPGFPGGADLDLDMALPPDLGGGAGPYAGGSTEPVDAPPEVQKEPTLRRTPHVEAPEELSTSRDSSFEIEVWTDKAPMSDREAGTEVVLEIPPDVDEIEVGVLVTVSPHFAVEGPSYGRLTLRRDVEEAEPLKFRLQVTGEGDAADAGIVVLFEYRGHPCGSVRRAWQWSPDAPTAKAVALQPPAEAGVAVHTEVTRPDLSVFVTAPQADGISFECSISTPLLSEYDSPSPGKEFAIQGGADRFVADQLRRFTDEGLSAAERKRELVAAGHEFWSAAPPLFRDVLQRMITSGTPPRNIYIASVEPNLPWELMIPTVDDEDGLPVDRDPLGVEFAVGRWVRADSKGPPESLTVRNAFVVAPVYGPNRVLDATAEIDLLKERLNGIHVEPATVDALDRRFQRETASVLHFVCHGAAGDADDAIYLDADETLRAGVVRALAGFKFLCRQARPLVFLNSCETGRLVRSLSGAAGFAKTFGELGARAIIAPLWPVDDGMAQKVALEVYQRALDDPRPPLAEIVRDVRARAYHGVEFDDSLAAYCFYGNPTTRMKVVP